MEWMAVVGVIVYVIGTECRIHYLRERVGRLEKEAGLEPGFDPDELPAAKRLG